MRLSIIVGLAAVCAISPSKSVPSSHRFDKVVCFWDSTSLLSKVPNHFTFEDLKLALPYCTHLIYGFAGIHPITYNLIPLHPELDRPPGPASRSMYTITTNLKTSFPGLKIYLSVGGNADPYEKTHKYLSMLERLDRQDKFIKSALDFCNTYGFDGIDLAWEFPTIKPHKSIFAKVKGALKKKSDYAGFKDKLQMEHQRGFNDLVVDLKNTFKLHNLAVTLTVLPNTNDKNYLARTLIRHLDAVHIMAYDRVTPERNRKEADYTAPLHKLDRNNRSSHENIESSIRHWHDVAARDHRVVLGIPAFGRTWRLDKKSNITGNPPFRAKGPGAPGPLTNTSGMLSYGEICSRFNGPSYERVTKIVDTTKKYGNYAFLNYNRDTKNDGIWIGYDGPETIENKIAYVKANGLGGIAIFDLSTEDYRGTCNGKPFPIVREVKAKLAD